MKSRSGGRAPDSLSEGEKMDRTIDLGSIKSVRQKSTKSNRIQSKSVSRKDHPNQHL